MQGVTVICYTLFWMFPTAPADTAPLLSQHHCKTTTRQHAGNEDEIYCELVKGLGESLVSGTVPGSALSFVAQKTDLRNPQVKTFPSKSNGMFVPESLIFRSDSNGEDLAGYAGAGLYESITMDPSTLDIVDFSADPIILDTPFRRASSCCGIV